MLGRKPHHAALGTPELGKVHPCYLGNPHSLGVPGTTEKGKDPPAPVLQRELRDLEGGSHLSVGWRRPPSYVRNPEPQRGSPSSPALGRGPCTAEEAPPSGGGPDPQHREEGPPQYFGNPMHQKMALSPPRKRESSSLPLPLLPPPFPSSGSTLATPPSGEGACPSPSREGLLVKTGKT